MFYRAMLKKENARKNGKKAFTLIELIIVIAIIGILIAILVPTMLGFLDDAKEATANANARSVYSAAMAAYAGAVSKGEKLEEGPLNTATDALLGEGFKGATYEIKWNAEQGKPVTGVKSVTFTSADGTVGQYPLKKDESK